MVVNCHFLYKDDGGYCLYYWVLLRANCGIIVIIKVIVGLLGMLDMVDSSVVVNGIIVAKL